MPLKGNGRMRLRAKNETMGCALRKKYSMPADWMCDHRKYMQWDRGLAARLLGARGGVEVTEGSTCMHVRAEVSKRCTADARRFLEKSRLLNNR